MFQSWIEKQRTNNIIFSTDFWFPLQPRNQWEVEEPEPEGLGEELAEDDGCIYDELDHEVESEDDGWFDQFIKNGGSVESDLGSAPEQCAKAQAAPKVLPAPANGKEVDPTRPVARPLSHSLATPPNEPGDVLMIEDSPVKVEEDDCETSGCKSEVALKEQKQREAQELREKLAKLEGEMRKAEWGPYLILLGFACFTLAHTHITNVFLFTILNLFYNGSNIQFSIFEWLMGFNGLWPTSFQTNNMQHYLYLPFLV